jgi:hypothetical protein
MQYFVDVTEEERKIQADEENGRPKWETEQLNAKISKLDIKTVIKYKWILKLHR